MSTDFDTDNTLLMMQLNFLQNKNKIKNKIK